MIEPLAHDAMDHRDRTTLDSLRKKVLRAIGIEPDHGARPLSANKMNERVRNRLDTPMAEAALQAVAMDELGSSEMRQIEGDDASSIYLIS